jgi:hypothetical protein
MVTDPRAKKSADRLRPLNAPRPLRVEADGDGRPRRLGSKRPSLGVREVLDCWRIDDEWWREPISRLYFQVELEDGRSLSVFHDLAKDEWFAQEY